MVAAAERAIHMPQPLKVEALAIFVVAAAAFRPESLLPVVVAVAVAPVSLETAVHPMVAMPHHPLKTV